MKVDYQVIMVFNDDGVTARFSGEEVKFEPEEGKSVRPRHLRLVTDIHQLVRDYIKNNN